MNVWYTCMQKNKDQYMYTHVLDMYVVHGTYMTYLCTYNILTHTFTSCNAIIICNCVHVTKLRQFHFFSFNIACLQRVWPLFYYHQYVGGF